MKYLWLGLAFGMGAIASNVVTTRISQQAPQILSETQARSRPNDQAPDAALYATSIVHICEARPDDPLCSRTPDLATALESRQAGLRLDISESTLDGVCVHENRIDHTCIEFMRKMTIAEGQQDAAIAQLERWCDSNNVNACSALGDVIGLERLAGRIKDLKTLCLDAKDHDCYQLPWMIERLEGFDSALEFNTEACDRKNPRGCEEALVMSVRDNRDTDLAMSWTKRYCAVESSPGIFAKVCDPIRANPQATWEDIKDIKTNHWNQDGPASFEDALFPPWRDREPASIEEGETSNSAQNSSD